MISFTTYVKKPLVPYSYRQRTHLRNIGNLTLPATLKCFFQIIDVVLTLAKDLNFIKVAKFCQIWSQKFKSYNPNKCYERSV